MWVRSSLLTAVGTGQIEYVLALEGVVWLKEFQAWHGVGSKRCDIWLGKNTDNSTPFM